MLAQKHLLHWSMLLLLPITLIVLTGCDEEKESITGPAIVDATVHGKVSNAINGSSISNVTITSDDLNTTTTNASGGYELGVSSGNRVLTFSSNDFIDVTK